MAQSHPLIITLKNLKGNARGCVYTEPLWGIPFNLYSPYVSVYMLALGLRDSQIGFLTSLSLFLQVFWTLLSGAITDKLGRKKATLIFDIISWSLPCFIWAIAQDYRYFLLAAIVNSVWRVTHNSWHCLLVEDTDPDLLVDIWSWIYIAGLLAAFFSPLTGLLIARYELIPTLRGLYALSFVMMTVKFIATNAMVTETQQGLVRMRQTQSQPLLAILRETPAVLQHILRSRSTLLTTGLMLVLGITRMISGTFGSILITEKLLIPAEHISIFPVVRSVTMLLTLFFIIPKMRHLAVRVPMIMGFSGLLASQLLLVLLPPKSYGWLVVVTIVDACSMPMATTFLETIMVLIVDAKERARIMAILNAIVLIFTSPFGWIAGQFSETNRRLPFILSIFLYVIGIALAYYAGRPATQKDVDPQSSDLQTVVVESNG